MTAEVLWISAKEIGQLGLSMAEIMDAVETGFSALGHGEVEMPAKIAIHPREDCFIHAMPCHLGGDIDRAGVKCVSGYPSNPARGLPYISGLLLLNDPATGLPQAVMDAAWITARRTGAASGVYARHCGAPETTTVAIIGTGVQGRVNLLAMKEVFPKLAEVRCFNIHSDSTARYIADMRPHLPDAAFTACGDVRDAVSGADVVITCTPMTGSPQRSIPRAYLKEDCLVITVDYDAAVDADVFRDAHFTCDDRTQYIRTRESGTYFQTGYPTGADIDADMSELCTGLKPGVRRGRRGAVLMGIASHDIMTAALIYDRAVKAGLGTKVEL